MSAIAPDLPLRFPCWCRAVYSFGPESKKDLGFVEGDLIECLNAGDGSWWMGRLHRDRRMMGLFPSNFVKVLDEGFRPMTRSTSPMPGSASPEQTPPQKQKSMFRKPFQAYAAPNLMVRTPEQSPAPTRQNSYLEESAQASSRRGSYLQSPTSSQSPSRQGSRQMGSQRDQARKYISRSPTKLNDYSTSQVPSRQNSYMKNDDTTIVGQNDYQNGVYSQPFSSRAPSPNPLAIQNYSRQPSPVPPSLSRQPSPGFQSQHELSRGPSPMPFRDNDFSRGPSSMLQSVNSSPPPPPPPHRVAYSQTGRVSSPAMSRAQSPIPPSPGHHAMTPSPLRDAMEDVMSSLQDMGMAKAADLPEREQSPLNPWSPEAFEQLRSDTQRRYDDQARNRPNFVQQEQYRGSDNGPNGDMENYVTKMERRLRSMEGQPQYINQNASIHAEMVPPPVPQKEAQRPASSYSGQPGVGHQRINHQSMFTGTNRGLDRTLTTKTSFSNMTQSTNTNSMSSAGHSLMSGSSAGAVSATSAGSMARRRGAWDSIRKARPMSAFGAGRDDSSLSRPQTPSTGMISYHSSHGSNRPASAYGTSWTGNESTSADLGGLTQTKPGLNKKRSGFLKKLVSSAKTGAANARNSIHGTKEIPRSPVKNMLPNGVTSIASSSVARSMGLGSGVASANSNSGEMDWMAVRRDVNRSNSLSRAERQERLDRCQMMDHPVIDAIDLLEEVAEGNEGIDGMAISEPTDFYAINFQLVDKNSRFITSLPLTITAASLSQGYVCRPYRSDVQRFRAIFTWVSEKISWEEDFEGEIDTRRVIQNHRGCAEEVAVLVVEMCQAVGLHADVIRGWLKPPGELPELSVEPYPNHWWNTVLVDGEWRIMDCSLASPTNPKRSLYSSASNVMAETFYFLTRPLEICYTHIPSDPAHQHIVPAIDPSILLALPCAMGPYFRNGLHIQDYSTALLFLGGLELLHLNVVVPIDVEIYAEVHARSFARDIDGDLFESGEQTVKRALCQVDWKSGAKRYAIKATLPGDEGSGTLNIYAGKRGLMHSIKDNPHSLATSIPIYHSGENPPFDFLTRHPTPHAQRHDLYVVQPQCKKLACNNTYVFSVRQHPSSLSSPVNSSHNIMQRPGTSSGMISPIPFIARPGSAMSMASSSASGSNPSTSNYGASSNTSVSSSGSGPQDQKPAKLAIQAPGGKILRLGRKIEGGLQDAGGTWETVVKIGERGVWRGLVLADRSARWCVWGEWECV